MAKSHLEVLIGSGDPSTLGMVSQAQASVYQNAPWMTLNMNSLQNLPPDAVETRLFAVQKVCLVLIHSTSYSPHRRLL